jgi:hypothetical protein
MSPFTIVVVLFLTILFAVLSFIPVLFGNPDMDSFEPNQQIKPKTAH